MAFRNKVNLVYKALRNRERDFSRKVYANHGIREPKLDAETRSKLTQQFPFLQIISRAHWERQWAATKARLENKLDLNRPVVWWVQTRSGGASSQSIGHLPRSQAWMFGKLAQTFPKPNSVILDDSSPFPIQDGTQIVVADDASYGGSQLSAGFQSLIRYLNMNAERMLDQKMAFTVYVAVPFMHVIAWDSVFDEIRGSMKYGQSVTRTSRSIRAKNRFFDLRVCFLGRMVHETKRHPMFVGSSVKHSFPSFILEHKVADESSLGAISKKIRAIYDPVPIYKQDTVTNVPKRVPTNRNREFVVGRPKRNTTGNRPFSSNQLR